MTTERSSATTSDPRLSVKDRTEITKNLFDILKSILIVIAIIVLVFDRGFLGSLLDRMNASKIAIGFITVERDVAANSIKANADALPKAQEALRAAQGEIASLKNGYERAVKALQASETALRDIKARSSASTAPASVKIATDLAVPILAQAPQRLQSADRAVAQLDTASQSATAAIRKLPGASSAGSEFAVVFGGDASQAAAQNQLKKGEGLGGRLHIFVRSGSYRSLAVFPTRESARAALPRFRMLPYAAEAYVVNLGSWCPGIEATEETINCGF